MNTETSDRKQVLLVDDVPDNLKILRNILAGHNYEIRISVNGLLALNSARKYPPDLILLDILMPEMDGYEVCRRLKSDEHTRDIPVIFISAMNEAFNKEQAFSAGGVDYITKPFQAGDVLARVKLHLSLQDSRKRLEEKNVLLERAEKSLRRQNEYLAELHQTSLDLFTHLNLDDLLRNTLIKAASLSSVSDGFIHLYDPKEKELRLAFGIGRFVSHTGLRMKPGQGLSGKVWQTGHPMFVEDYRAWPGRYPGSDFDFIRSKVVIPLQSRNRMEGVIGLAVGEEGKSMGQEEISVLELFAKLASVALDNVQLYTEMKQEVAERRKTEEELKQAKAAAEAANRAKSQFLANISHEIRTPMNSVLGFLDLAIEDPCVPEPQTKNLKTARNSAKSLLSLINSVLDVSKMESGRMELEQCPFDLHRMLHDTIKTFEIRCREKGLELSLDIHPDVLVCYTGDPERLRQIVINLTGNAVKFTSRGRVRVSVSPYETGELLHFAVSDTGIGIPADRLEKIFEPFTQVDGSTARKFGGTGLGTTISRQLAQLMGGKMWVESEEGKGSTFHFTVGLKISDLKASDDIMHDDQSECSNCLSGRSLRVLIAEDLEENMMLARIRLEQAGHTVIEARNGREAVNIFRKEKPDIILMDVHMPEMDGLEAAQHIRELESLVNPENHIPIIALTASVMKQEQRECLDAGMDAVAGKPVDFPKLLADMERLVPETCKGSPVCKNRKIMNAADGESAVSCTALIPCRGVDIRKGIENWQNEKVYCRTLLNFCRNYENAADNILEMLAHGDREGAYRIAHSLTGVAGNLFVTEVYQIAAKLGTRFREKSGNNQELLPLIRELGTALQDAIAAIRQMIPESDRNAKQDVTGSENLCALTEAESASQGKEKIPDLCVLRELFCGMLSAFEQYNPGEVEPFLEKLEAFLPVQLEPVKQHLDRFDFDQAREETLKLAGELGIDV